MINELWDKIIPFINELWINLNSNTIHYWSLAFKYIMVSFHL